MLYNFAINIILLKDPISHPLGYFKLKHYSYRIKNVHDHATHITSVKPISQKWVENNIIHVAILRTCNNEKLQFFLKQILANCSNKLQPESIPQTCRQRIKGYIIVNQRLLHLKVIVKNRSRQEHVYTDIISIYLHNFEKIFTLDIDNEINSNI